MTELTANISKAARAICMGAIVAFPTDTVFGLGTNAFNDKAVKRLYQVKRRSMDKPFIINIASLEMIKDIVIVRDEYRGLIDSFWPGSVTFIFKKKRNVLKAVSSGKMTLAVRIPACKETINLIKKASCPIVSTSANFEGDPVPRYSSEISSELIHSIDVILKESRYHKSGVPSTIVDLSGKKIRILRAGDIKIVRKLEKYMLKFSY